MVKTLLRVLKRFYRSRYFAPVAITAFVLLANGLYLTKFAEANPINVRSGLVDTITLGNFNGQFTIDPSDGYYAQALGRRVAVEAARGNIPWWNYYEGVGAPLVGGLQSAALFPLQWLLILPNGLLYLHIAIEIIAGLGVYYLLRRLRCHDKAALVGGMAFAAHGTFAWIAHTIVNPIAFLPWLLLGVENTLDKSRAGKPRGWLLFAAAICLTVYAGFPETGFINGLFAILWAAVRFRTIPRQSYVPAMKKLAMGAVVGVGLSAPLLIAFAGYLPYANLGLHAESTADLILPKVGLASLVMPYVFGPIFGSYNLDTTNTLYALWATVGGYLSLPLLILAGIGLSKGAFSRSVKTYLLSWTLFCVCATYGLFWMNHVAAHIPLIGVAAFARYFPPSYALAVIMLAAAGMTYLWNRRSKPLSYRFGLTTGLVALAAVTGLWVMARVQYDRLEGAARIVGWYHGSFIWAVVIILVLTAVLVLQKRINRRLAAGITTAVVLVDAAVMFAIPMLSAPRDATINTQPVVYLKEHLGTTGRFFSLGPVAPNYGSYYGIASVNINDIPQPQRYSDYITKKLDPNVNPITFTGTNYNDPRGVLPPQALLDNMSNYEYAGVTHVITPPATYTEAQSQAAGLNQVYKDRTAEIYTLPAPKPYFEAVKGNCRLQVEARDRLQADCKGDAQLVRREQFLPGWTARINGSGKAPTAYADLFQTVSLPKGKSTVSFDYLPPYMIYGYIAAVIAAGTVVAALLWPSGKYATVKRWVRSS